MNDLCARTLDHAHLDPFAADPATDVDRVARLASALRLTLEGETGARFRLDS
jgi:hypothetical protein